MKLWNTFILTGLFLVFGVLGFQVHAQGAQDQARQINYQYTGELDKEDLTNSPYTARWFNQRYKIYRPAPNAVETIKEHIGDYEIEVYMGTWCPDSHREIPRFYKLMEQADYDESKVTVYTLDRRNSSVGGTEKGKNIIAVPTIIFYKDGIEVNRFIEHARESIARDIAKIVSGEPYKDYHTN